MTPDQPVFPDAYVLGEPSGEAHEKFIAMVDLMGYLEKLMVPGSPVTRMTTEEMRQALMDLKKVFEL